MRTRGTARRVAAAAPVAAPARPSLDQDQAPLTEEGEVDCDAPKDEAAYPENLKREQVLERVLKPAIDRVALCAVDTPAHIRASRILADRMALLEGVAGFDPSEVEDAVRALTPRAPGASEPAAAVEEDPAPLTLSHHQFANPRARTCWLSCTFQVLWHSEIWHRAFGAAVESGCFDDSDDDEPGPKRKARRLEGGGAASREDDKLRALARTWRAYASSDAEARQSAADDWSDYFSLPEWLSSPGADGEPPPRFISPAALARAFRDAADRRGYGDCADAISLVAAAAESHGDAQVRGLAALLRVVPVEFTGRAPDLAATYEAAADAFGLRGAPVVAFDVGWEVTLDAESVALTTARLAATAPRHYRLAALVAYSKTLRHYVCFCAARGTDEILFFNDLPGTLLYSGVSGRTRSKAQPAAVASASRRRLKSWSDIAERCSKFCLQPRCVVVEREDYDFADAPAAAADAPTS